MCSACNFAFNVMSHHLGKVDQASLISTWGSVHDVSKTLWHSYDKSGVHSLGYVFPVEPPAQAHLTQGTLHFKSL